MLPSLLGFFISSTRISFFLTLRVEFTSLCNLLNFTDSSVSSSDCSLDWQRNKRKVNQVMARSSALAARAARRVLWPEPGAPTNLPNSFLKLHLPTILGSKEWRSRSEAAGHTPLPLTGIGAFCVQYFPGPCQENSAGLSPRLALGFQFPGCGLGQALLCLVHQDLLFKRGHQLLLQTKILLTCSSPPRKSKPAGQEKGREAKAAVPVTREDLLPHLSHPCGLSQLLPPAHQASVRTAPAFLREGQGKKLTFPALHYSPYSPASHSVLQ